MLTREWIKQFREQATTADIKVQIDGDEKPADTFNP